jgi:HK97 family phage major capsid protein
MQENSELMPVYVQKADMAVSQLTSGGKLVREQLSNFLLVAIKASVMLSQVRRVVMSRDEREIPKMTTFGSRVWYPATEMEELPLAQRVRPGFDKVTVTTTEIICQVNFPKYFLKAQVEGPAFRNTLIAYLGLHSARDFDDLIINGDTTSADVFLALFNGMIASATSNTYAAGAASLSGDILDATIQTMPEEYEDQANLAFHTNRGARAAYRKELGTRMTPLGDSKVTSGGRLTYDDVEVVKVPMFPTTLGVGSNETVVMYQDAKQFLFAIEEDVELETDYHKAARMWSIIMTARVGQTYEHEPAVVKTTGVLAAA